MYGVGENEDFPCPAPCGQVSSRQASINARANFFLSRPFPRKIQLAGRKWAFLDVVGWDEGDKQQHVVGTSEEEYQLEMMTSTATAFERTSSLWLASQDGAKKSRGCLRRYRHCCLSFCLRFIFFFPKRRRREKVRRRKTFGANFAGTTTIS